MVEEQGFGWRRDEKEKRKKKKEKKGTKRS
jgi:hypothetical protein